MLLSWAYARAEAQYLAPVEYTAFIWASLFGLAIFCRAGAAADPRRRGDDRRRLPHRRRGGAPVPVADDRGCDLSARPAR